MEHFPKSTWQKPGDRRTGLSQEQSAIAAARAAIQGALSDETISELVVAQILGHRNNPRASAPWRLDQLARSTRGRSFQFAPWRPTRAVPADLDHGAYVSQLLHPLTGNMSLSLIAGTFLGTDQDRHAIELDAVRAASRTAQDKAYRYIIAGDCGAVVTAARDGKLASHDREHLVGIARTHTRCQLIRSAHERISDVRLLSLAPLGDRFSGFNTWHLVGHTCLSTIAAPASVLQRLAALGPDPGLAGLADPILLNRLITQNILPRAEGGRIIAIAQLVRAKLGRMGIDFATVASLLEHIRDVTVSASQLNRGDMIEAGWSKMDFVEFRIGLTASEASAFVGLELLRAFRAVDERIEDILTRVAYRGRRNDWIPKERSHAFASVLLRAEGLPDKAAKPHDPTEHGPHCDPIRGSGRTGVASMLIKIGDPEIHLRAKRALGIDVSRWFKR